jgi:hypothetical protein
MVHPFVMSVLPGLCRRIVWRSTLFFNPASAPRQWPADRMKTQIAHESQESKNYIRAKQSIFAL